MGKRRRGQLVAAGRKYTSGWYDYRKGTVCLAYRDSGRLVHEERPFKWYFFLRKDDAESLLKEDERFRRMVGDVKAAEHGFVRVYSSGDWEARREVVDHLRGRGVEPFEADLAPFFRYQTDSPVEFSEDLRLLFYDLETDARQGWGLKEEHRILSIAWHGHDGETKFSVARDMTDPAEKVLIEEYLHAVGESDVLVAWNGDEYDELVLRARCKAHRLFPRWRMVNFLDFLRVFKHPYFGYGRDAEGAGVKVSFALGNIAKKLLGEDKVDIVQAVADRFDIDIRNPADAVIVAFESARDILEEYNRRDVDLMVELERKFGYLDSLKTLSHVCNRFLSSWCTLTGYLNDAFVLRYGARKGVRFPTKQTAYHKDETWREDLVKIEGGLVTEPVVGLHSGVCYLDFASLYPNIMRTFNISPETKVVGGDGEALDGAQDATLEHPHAIASNGVVFRTDVEGIFPKMMAESMELRDRYKKEALALQDAGKEGSVEWRRAKQRSDAYKLTGNAGIGMLGSPMHRYYDPECAGAVTETGQEIITQVNKLGEERGLKHLFTDTDGSGFKSERAKAVEFIEEVPEDIDKWVFVRGGIPGYIRLELDAEYDRIVLVAKKRYAAKKVTGSMEIKGLEFVRTDGCAYAREFQKVVIDYLLLSPEWPDAETARKMVVEWRDRLYAGKVDVEKLVLAQSMQKPIGEYKNNPVHVRIAKDLLNRGEEVYVGMKIPYVVTGKKDGRLEAVYVRDFEGEYDAKVYWRDKVFPPAMRVLDAAFPNEKWKGMEKHDPRQEDIFDGLQGDQRKFAEMVVGVSEVGQELEKIPVMFRVGEDDAGRLEALKRVFTDYPGTHPLKLEMIHGIDVTVVDVKMRVKMVPNLVREIEEMLGRKAYFGRMDWDEEVKGV